MNALHVNCAKGATVNIHVTTLGFEQQACRAEPNTGIEWSKTLLEGEAVNYKAAEKAIAELGDGWRMPTREELLTLVDLNRHDPCIDAEKYPDTKSRAYWTATPCAWNESARWVVNFGDGYLGAYHDGYDACVRAVRASQ